MTSAVPAIIDAVIALARANTGATVYDGRGVSNEPGDYLMVGVDDAEKRVQRAVNNAQSWPYAGSQTRQENGEVFCTARSGVGDAGDEGTKAARDAVYAVVADLENALKAQKDVGIDAFACEVTFGSRSELTQSQDNTGAWAALTFRLAFQAWTTT